MDTAFFIALRYLFAKKSHNVINVISAISSIGMAVGTAALILILSIYNGFDNIIESRLSSLEPDVLVIRGDGRDFVPDEQYFDRLSEDERISSCSYVLEEKVFVSYGNNQAIARAKGVDSSFEELSPLSESLVAGKFELHFGELPQAIMGAELAHELAVNLRLHESLDLFYPKGRTLSPLAGPMSALSRIKMRPAGLISINSKVDAELILLPLESLRSLLGKDKAVSAIEIRCDESASKGLIKEIQEDLGPEYQVLDRYRQDPAIYKMMRYEKLAIYGILIFVIIIIAFNIFASLSMLIIEKKEDMGQLRAMGAKDSMIRRIFVLEGWMSSLLGLVCGMVLGVGFALLQEHFGLVKMPAGFFVDSYPCILELGDVLLTALGVGLSGLLISLFSTRKINS